MEPLFNVTELLKAAERAGVQIVAMRPLLDHLVLVLGFRPERFAANWGTWLWSAQVPGALSAGNYWRTYEAAEKDFDRRADTWGRLNRIVLGR